MNDGTYKLPLTDSNGDEAFGTPFYHLRLSLWQWVA